MDATGFGLPLRIDIATGERLAPTGQDPYELPWVQGAASSVPRQTRIRYAHQLADLREKLDVLRSKRAKKDDGLPLWGPRLRPSLFRTMHGRPSVDGLFE